MIISNKEIALARTQRRFAWLLVPLGMVAALLLTGCADGQPVDEGTPAPAAFESPVDHQLYCAWRENQYECDGSGYPPAPFAMPDNDLDRTTQGVAEDYSLLEALLLYHITYHAFFDNPWYFDTYITPAWSAHPGTYYGWSGHPVVRVTNVTYYTVNSRSFDNRYRDRERSTASQATYRTKTGKTYNGKTVPSQKFKGSNAKPSVGNGPSNRKSNAARPTGARPTGTRATGGTKATGQKAPRAGSTKTNKKRRPR